MYTIVIALSIIASILLIIVVLIQKSKGGGLSSTFAGSNQIMGVRRTNDFIEKTTWTLASIICVLAIVAAFVMPRTITGAQSRVKANAPIQVEGTEYATPAAPATPVAEEAPAAPEVPAAPAN